MALRARWPDLPIVAMCQDLRGAPATLYRRCPPWGLDQILTEGMLAPSRKPEEGSPDHHPRRPMLEMDDDEVAQLKACLRSLDRRPWTPPLWARGPGVDRSRRSEVFP